ncbi:ITM2A-like protein [Mya arenaria]|uniref:Integral membrane protein 2 n=1 Tax=Mya arenaria TaxID=6604 RepID=A0ABY7G206_MYAAR|nr:ITM2A-like protein [Mya arenaria]
MTIIKVSKDGKLLAKKKVDETTVPLTPDGGGGPGLIALTVDYQPSRRTKNVVNIFLLILALLVLASTVIGGFYLYKYMAHKHHKQRVTIEVQDRPVSMATMAKQSRTSPPMVSYTMYEEIDVELDTEVERIEVPQFDECRRSLVMHDFFNNYTVIVDQDDQECFIMPLDREHMKPPRSFSELVQRYASGYYMPKVDVVRRDYEVMRPMLTDLQFAGNAISAEDKVHLHEDLRFLQPGTTHQRGHSQV